MWLAGPKDDPFIGGSCAAVEAAGTIKLKMDNGEEKSVDPSKVDVLAGNETGITASDHCALINMNEPCVLENSQLRFLDDAIYTLVGTIMIAINPFARIDIYGPERMKKIRGQAARCAWRGGAPVRYGRGRLSRDDALQEANGPRNERRVGLRENGDREASDELHRVVLGAGRRIKRRPRREAGEHDHRVLPAA